MKLSLTIFLSLWALISSAQLTASKDTATSQGEISWNVGHVVYDSYENSTVSLESPLTIQRLVTSVEEETLSTISVFPNPVVEDVSIKFTNMDTFTFQVINSKGKVFYKGSEAFINMSSYPAGTYFIQFLNEEQPTMANYKIIKQ